MKKNLLFFALFFVPSLSYGCDCLYYQSFCEVISPTSKVASVRIFNTYRETSQYLDRLWLDVVVEENLLGAVEHDTMTILASHGTSCDPAFEFFQVGDQLVVEVKNEEPSGPTDWYTFRFFNGCQEPFLVLKDGSVTGHITGDEYESQPYETFKQNLGTCSSFTRVFEQAELERWVQLLPVPAATECLIHMQVDLDYEMSVLTTTGQLVRQARVVNDSRYHFAVADLPNGLYFVRLKVVGDAMLIKRLVVQH